MEARRLVGAAVGSLLVFACSSQPGDGSEAPDEATGQDASVEAAHVDEAPTAHRRRLANGLLPGMMPYRAEGAQIAAAPSCNTPKLTYFGGPIIQSPIIVTVFWNSLVNAQVQANLAQFFADVTESTLWPWLQEYDSVGLTSGGHTGNQVVLSGTSGGSAVLTPVVCPASTTGTCHLTDAQLQTELIRQIGMSVLPAPTLDCTGNARTLYMVSFPHNVSLTGPEGAGTSCVQFCAYHNTGTYGASATPLIYGALMDEFTGGCSGGCGRNTTALENTTDTASHELVEAVTDPDIGLDTSNNYAYPAGWGDNNNNCGEIGDICDNDGAGDTITVSGRTWTVQEMWSNAQGICTSTGTTHPVCSGTTLTGCRKCSCGDNGGACSGATPICETTSTNVLFGGCEQCTATGGGCATGVTCAQSTTPAQDDICNTCTPITACPAGDNCGTVSNGCGGTLACGTCTAPQTCGGGAPGSPNVCGCTPSATSCPAGDNCGTVPNGCGGTISCGTCTVPQTCGGGAPGSPNVCGCTPTTTRCPAGQNCGTVPDGCGGTVSCGTCTSPQTCGGGTPGSPNVCGCTPSATSCPAGENCGTVPNGCGGTISCGTCTGPQTCGGGAPGSPNVCGCTPSATSCPAGENCGTVPNGCGGTITCGTCSAPQTCGGGIPSTPNVCGCAPLLACPLGDNCGAVPDGCGGAVVCGACSGLQTCGGGTPSIPNVCGCTPITTSCPAGDTCGTVTDECGGTITCGVCTSPQTCGGGTPSDPNRCGCTPIAACPAGDRCGTIDDGCGGTVACGACDSSSTCVGNQCVVNVVDAGGGSDGGMVTDAGGGNDGGMGIDAGGGGDGGMIADAGGGDSGTSGDAGAGDSGAGADGGGARDSGADSGGVADASTGVDSGASDSGVHADSGIALDASTEDDGGEVADAGGSGVAEGGGCGCRTTPTGSSRGAAVGVLALGLIAVRRRKRAA